MGGEGLSSATCDISYLVCLGDSTRKHIYTASITLVGTYLGMGGRPVRGPSGKVPEVHFTLEQPGKSCPVPRGRALNGRQSSTPDP